jgi:uncharacterized membrane protein YjdF
MMLVSMRSSDVTTLVYLVILILNILLIMNNSFTPSHPIFSPPHNQIDEWIEETRGPLSAWVNRLVALVVGTKLEGVVERARQQQG